MKKAIFLLTPLFFVYTMHSQVLNGDFESWTNPTTPDNWDTSNSINGLTEGVLQATPGHDSQYCAHLYTEATKNTPNPTYIHQTLDVAQTPNSMSFFIQGNLALGDTLYAMATVLDAEGNILGAGVSILDAFAFDNWQEVETSIFPFGSGNAAYCDLNFMMISYDADHDSELFIDDITIDGTTAGISEAADAIQVYSTNDKLVYSMATSANVMKELSIYSMRGELITQVHLDGPFGFMDISALSSGMYIACFSDGLTTFERKFLK